MLALGLPQGLQGQAVRCSLSAPAPGQREERERDAGVVQGVRQGGAGFGV